MQKISYTFICFCLLACLGLLPHAAYAASTSDLVTQAQQLGKEVAIIPKFVAMIAYVVGAIFAFRGLLALRRYIDNADENPVLHVVGYLVASALLIALPYIITLSKNTLGVQQANVLSSSGSFDDKGFGR